MEYNTIEEKLAALPIVPFDNSEAFQQVLFSPLFDDIFHYYMDNYSTDRIKTQSELNQRLSLYLHITNQDEELAQNINDLIYRRPCPTIEQFIEDPYYLGTISGTIYPYWKQKLIEIFNPEHPIKKVLFSGATGTGKGLLLNEIIPTPTGYIKVKDLKVNDYLWGKNGKPTKILKIFDRGLQPIYKVHFDDNTTVTCDSDHLWEIIDYTQNKTIIRDTTWLATHKLHKNPRKDNSGKLLKYGINYCQPVEYSQKEYSVSPYLLGVLLGDGHIGETVNISNHIKDIEIINKCTSLLPMEYTFSLRETSKDVYQYQIIRKSKSNISYKKYIEGLGLSNRNSNTKFIPEEYKLGSIEQRLELLRGLMDTDGSISIKKSTNSPNRITFGTVSEQLANDVAELVRSLGGRAKIASQDRRQTKASCNFIEYEVRIWLELNPFSLKRKADLFIPRLIKKKIVSVEKAGENKTRCFVVDAEDHLFLCNDYIVTHNSRTAEKACIYALYRLLCLRYPRKILNIEAQSTIAMFILSVTQKTAYQVLFQPFIELLSNMPCFQRVRQARAFENFDLNNPKCPIPWYVDKSNMTIIFPDNIILTLGSQLSNTVGYDILISECFTGNTKVWTNYGVFTFDYLNKNWKIYDNLKVKTRLPDNSIVDSLIKDVKQTNLVNNLIRLYITDDDYIECTPDHKFLLRSPKKKDPNVIWENNQGYKQAQFLTKDDDIDNKRLISFDKDILYNLYITQNKTYEEIAKIFNCKSGDVVKKYCMKFNIYKGNELRIKNGNRKFKEKYGVNNPSQVKEIQNRKKKTCLQKYGSEYFLNSQSLKSLYSIEYWNKNNDKIYNTKKLHNTFNTSKPEEEIYQLLLQKYFQVERQYRSELYPFNCDFYIPSLDLYIEYNGTWEHGNKPYDENNQECINLTKKWISKNKPRYKNAIKIYTIRDPEKRKIAKENNLNWIEFFNMKEFLNWYNKGDNVEV